MLFWLESEGSPSTLWHSEGMSMADKLDQLFAACVMPFKPGQEEVDETALRNFMR
jgi:hypothetical protein